MMMMMIARRVWPRGAGARAAGCFGSESLGGRGNPEARVSEGGVAAWGVPPATPVGAYPEPQFARAAVFRGVARRGPRSCREAPASGRAFETRRLAGALGLSARFDAEAAIHIYIYIYIYVYTCICMCIYIYI